MTKPPDTHIGPSEAAARHGGRLLPPARYRHPGDVVRLIVAGLVLAGAVAVAAAPWLNLPWRRTGQLVPGSKSDAASLRRVVQSTGKMIMQFEGPAVITLAYVGALAASIQAFGAGPGVIVIGAAYMDAAAIAAAAPNPGDPGAIEAALTGVGMQSGPAVSAVLPYRLATYWLPVPPGWLAWRALLWREYA